jgi:hypothetical protein
MLRTASATGYRSPFHGRPRVSRASTAALARRRIRKAAAFSGPRSSCRITPATTLTTRNSQLEGNDTQTPRNKLGTRWKKRGAAGAGPCCSKNRPIPRLSVTPRPAAPYRYTSMYYKTNCLIDAEGTRHFRTETVCTRRIPTGFVRAGCPPAPHCAEGDEPRSNYFPMRVNAKESRHFPKVRFVRRAIPLPQPRLFRERDQQKRDDSRDGSDHRGRRTG